MSYVYLTEENAIKNVTYDNIVLKNDNYSLTIMCYYIEKKIKYPFLQFLLEKKTLINEEKLIFPTILFKKSSLNISQIILNNVKIYLNTLGYDNNCITIDMFKGIIFFENNCQAYALVNITDMYMPILYLTKKLNYLFVLPSEIINIKRMDNINIDNDVIQLFTNTPQISFLFNYKTNNYYILPDVVYTSGPIEEVKFNSVFGNSKKKIYNNCDKYYFFNRSYYDTLDYVNIYFKCKNVDNILGINRYVLFVEGNMCLEENTEFTLTDNIIEEYFGSCIIICYLKKSCNPDILVKTYESFLSLSYHTLD
jgi:hypothetical protein